MNFYNHALLIELENFLKGNKISFKKEVLFSKIIKTDRKFRTDYYIPEMKIIIEINGGQYVNGRHNRGGKGYENDLIKSNLANMNGFIYLQYTYQQLGRKLAIKDLRNIIKIKNSKDSKK